MDTWFWTMHMDQQVLSRVSNLVFTGTLFTMHVTMPLRQRLWELVEPMFESDCNAGENKFSYRVTSQKITLKKACNQIGRYERREAISLLEMWLWKMKIQSMRNVDKGMGIVRESSHARCGTRFIIPTVVKSFFASSGWIKLVVYQTYLGQYPYILWD